MMQKVQIKLRQYNSGKKNCLIADLLLVILLSLHADC